ncbi:uncharacterized protein SCHCODRAFT_01089529 [Schizophyllum commune H4-8]|nr:uncharacterized protein SCHCODRAFT_01089529 [Schizophyllum commune H4-8]KAI5894536.1 hypothetical protein SCHCODRAFT_01089529 [Schizophyllum commune H4-8]
MQTSASLRSGNLACLAGANGLERLELSFYGKDYDSPLREIQVPTFPRLKHLSVDAPRVSAPPLFTLLWSCRATLDSLWLCFRKLTSVDDAAAPSMTVLRSLRLEEHAHCVLPLIDTPALEDIYVGNVLRRNPFASLVASEATARIQRLALFNFSVYGPDEPSVWASLEHMQCLEALELDTLWQVSFSEQLIARLTCAEDRTPLLRRMTALCLQTELYVELTLEIRAMVASRRNARHGHVEDRHFARSHPAAKRQLPSHAEAQGTASTSTPLSRAASEIDDDDLYPRALLETN